MNQNARTCDSCLGLGLSRPKHFQCSGGGCSCCGAAPSTKVRRPKLKAAPAPPPPPRAPRTSSPHRRKDPSVLLRHRVTPAELVAVGELRRAGRSWREVAAEMGRDHTSLRKAAEREGIDTTPATPPAPKVRPDTLTDQEVARAEQLRQMGLTWREVGGALGRDPSGLCKTIGGT